MVLSFLERFRFNYSVFYFQAPKIFPFSILYNKFSCGIYPEWSVPVIPFLCVPFEGFMKVGKGILLKVSAVVEVAKKVAVTFIDRMPGPSTVNELFLFIFQQRNHTWNLYLIEEGLNLSGQLFPDFQPAPNIDQLYFSTFHELTDMLPHGK
jgi:hypothetical protein